MGEARVARPGGEIPLVYLPKKINFSTILSYNISKFHE